MNVMTKPARGKRIQDDDLSIAVNIRRMRIELGISQEKLAEACGITFQQIQKYENGTNRVSGSRMVQIAKCFGVPVAAILHGVGDAPGVAVEGVDLTSQEVRTILRLRRVPKAAASSIGALIREMAGEEAE